MSNKRPYTTRDIPPERRAEIDAHKAAQYVSAGDVSIADLIIQLWRDDLARETAERARGNAYRTFPQAAIARAVGVSRQYVNQILRQEGLR